jgi:hypothetical protein
MHLRIPKNTLEDSVRRHLGGGAHLADPRAVALASIVGALPPQPIRLSLVHHAPTAFEVQY